MKSLIALAVLSCVLNPPLLGATKPHTLGFGKWTVVRWLVGPDEDQSVDLKVRPLYVDGHVKEYTLGPAHDITDRLFVVQRAFRLNDGLPGDKSSQPVWRWQRGGWLLVDRTTGHISPVYLPEFDSYYSVATWYRDYGAYCGVSEDGEKVFHVVIQLGRRRPVLKKPAGRGLGDDAPDSACLPPAWQRQPARVTFFSGGEAGATYQVRGHAVDLIKEDADDEAGSD